MNELLPANSRSFRDATLHQPTRAIKLLFHEQTSHDFVESEWSIDGQGTAMCITRDASVTHTAHSAHVCAQQTDRQREGTHSRCGVVPVTCLLTLVCQLSRAHLRLVSGCCPRLLQQHPPLTCTLFSRKTGGGAEFHQPFTESAAHLLLPFVDSAENVVFCIIPKFSVHSISHRLGARNEPFVKLEVVLLCVEYCLQ